MRHGLESSSSAQPTKYVYEDEKKDLESTSGLHFVAITKQFRVQL